MSPPPHDAQICAQTYNRCPEGLCVQRLELAEMMFAAISAVDELGKRRVLIMEKLCEDLGTLKSEGMSREARRMLKDDVKDVRRLLRRLGEDAVGVGRLVGMWGERKDGMDGGGSAAVSVMLEGDEEFLRGE
ncbi:uncharacterized protein H6S33_005452 [Morchella sextelata]|uniref:uncharacterized protein n=1 Tax=Morchella sextelata TaxID=1174677 RepID=UPI001D04CE47|nr:uncharacterized protein H6S33_005452 [Morchella sextelata]KAH0613566.1 hypothetical protein H6S33_005452 [Morchella sextelata]